MKKTHGMSNTRIYRIWQGMKQRCKSTRKKIRAIYFDKGITVCDEWKDDFLSFYNWAMENGYFDNLVIDRENPNGNYEPSNCKWITKEQNSKKGWIDTNIWNYLKRYPGTDVRRIRNYDKALRAKKEVK